MEINRSPRLRLFCNAGIARQIRIIQTGKMTGQESDALKVLAPGTFIRAGVRCPDCRHGMTSQPEKRGSLIHWNYVCDRCGTVQDTNFKIVSSVNIWRQLGSGIRRKRPSLACV